MEKPPASPPTPVRSRPYAAYLVFAGSLAITIAIAAYIHVTARARGQAQFDNLSERNQQAIRRRLDASVALLRGAAGLFSSQQNKVTRDQFAAYVDRLDLPDRYPEVQGIGVSGMSVGDDLAGLVETMHNAGVADFKIRPEGQRPQYHAVIYLEPQTARNRTEIGYDMFTDPTRRAAMELARDSGNAVTSARVALHGPVDDQGGQGRAGFLIYVPIYVTNVTPATRDERRSTIGGYIFSPFRVAEFMTGIFGGEPFPAGVSFAVYDGEPSADTLLYQSDRAFDENARDARFNRTVPFAVPGRQWMIRYASESGFDDPSARGVAGVLVAGAVISAVLFAMTAAQVEARRRAEHAAHETRVAKEAAELARDVAERASASKDEFLATVSHELRTPLTPALLAVSSLERERDLPPQVREDVAAVREHIETEARLISDLLDMTRIVRGGLRLDPRDAVDLHALLRGLVDRRRDNLAAAGLAAIRTELSATRHILRGDAARLKQVFENLIDNAQKFTPAGGTITVRTTDAHDPDVASDNNDTVRIEVADTGIGIDHSVLPKLFSAFEQGEVRADRQHAGLGLGLAIAKSLVEAHRGRLFAYSEGRGRGSTFVVELPGARQPTANEAREGATPACTDPTGHALRVLVVEDHEPTLRVLRRLLSQMGCTVVCATTFSDATDAASREHYDVLVSDLSLPDGSGLDLMRRLRDEYAGRAIALTGYTTPEDVAATHEAGFAAHLSKPIVFSQLEAAIRALATPAAISPSPGAPGEGVDG